jgi:hypothetical protein
METVSGCPEGAPKSECFSTLWPGPTQPGTEINLEVYTHYVPQSFEYAFCLCCATGRSAGLLVVVVVVVVVVANREEGVAVQVGQCASMRMRILPDPSRAFLNAWVRGDPSGGCPIKTRTCNNSGIKTMRGNSNGRLGYEWRSSSAVRPALFNAVCCITITNSPAERTGLSDRSGGGRLTRPAKPSQFKKKITHTTGAPSARARTPTPAPPTD